MTGALSGIRVLELSRVLAGPWCGQILADLGADVIKVERPSSGDDTRAWGPPFMSDDAGNSTLESSYYQSTNRGKRSVAIDISRAEGQALVRELVKGSDVLIENFKVGALTRYGLDYDELSRLNPRLIYCSITGFGQTGPRALEPGYDFIVQGLAGLMSITGERDDRPGGGPQKVGVAVADLMSGLYAVIAIQAALVARETTGRGQHCDIALLDVQIAALANQSMNYLTSGRAPPRYGNAHANIVPYQVFHASDRDFIVACGNDAQFVALCAATDLAGMAQDPRFARNSDRIAHRDELEEMLAARFKSATAAEWIAKIQALKVPAGPINDIAQALAEPQVAARQMIVNIPHPQNGKFQMIGSPIKLSDTCVSYTNAAPMLGQHTNAVLGEQLGLSDACLDALATSGVISRIPT